MHQRIESVFLHWIYLISFSHHTFLREAKLKDIRTLEELNHYWEIYLEEYYHNKPHDGIREYYESLGVTLPQGGISPRTEFNRDSRPLSYIDVSVMAEAFLHHEERKVDKGACIRFRSRKYETKPELIGHTVQIAYDPVSPETLTVSYPGMEPFTARPMKIGRYCDKNPTLPVGMQGQKPVTSRFLDALERKHEESTQHKGANSDKTEHRSCDYSGRFSCAETRSAHENRRLAKPVRCSAHAFVNTDHSRHTASALWRGRGVGQSPTHQPAIKQ